MSEWINAKKEDISMLAGEDDLHIWIGRNENGNKYISVNTKDLIDILAKEGLINKI